MNYYEVLVASAYFHGHEALTYSSSEVIEVGQIVSVPLKQGQALGIVAKAVNQPKFPTKTITTVESIPKMPEVSLKMIDWIKTYYPAPLGMIVQQFLPKTLSEKRIKNLLFTTANKQKSTKLPPLTSEQKKVLKNIGYGPGSFLLHGETGSGKTRIYLELSLRAYENKQSILILTPEISLTSQLTTFFEHYFPGKVILLHSRLTESERRNCWLYVLNSSEPLVVIGPRSALFAPFKKLGLIVVDEAHETGYKQEQAPHYSALRVAAQLSKLHHATLLMGSATPSINEYYFAEHKKLPILRMEALAIQTEDELPSSSVHVIAMTDHGQFTQASHISDPLIKSIKEALKRHEQSLLFLNRRGTARVILCQNCGWQSLCPRCDLPLTYHGDSHSCLCHICGHHEPSPTSCPECGSPDIVFKSIGTKAIADEAKRLFPDAEIRRYDTDSKKTDSFDLQYDSIKAGNVDILVGTQTLAKGLDLPHLSVVGVIVADTSLYLPDYTANERTYQLLHQVLGRVGRGHIAGKAFVQSYDPTNPTIQAAVNRDWLSFYRAELQERQTFLFPPYCFLLKLTCRRISQEAAKAAATRLGDQLKLKRLQIQIVGPSPAFHEKSGGKFQWQLIIKTKQRGELLKTIANLPSGWSYDIDPADLL